MSGRPHERRLERPRLARLQLGDAAVHDVVLEDVADVLHRLATDPLRHHPLHLPEPLVRVEAAARRLPPQLGDPHRPGSVSFRAKVPRQYKVSWFGSLMNPICGTMT